MRILQISSAESFGSGEEHLVALARGLNEMGEEIFVAVRPETDWRERLSFVPDENFLFLPMRSSLDVSSARRLAEFIREKNVEVVHAYSARDYLPASLAVRLAPAAKLVLTRRVSFPLKGLQRYSLSNVAGVIAVSGAVRECLQKNFPAEKIHVVPDGSEIEKWARADRREPGEAFRARHNIPFDALLIGTIGDLKPLNGQEDFVLAAQVIAAKHPEARFLVVGRDNSFNRSFRRKLKRLVKIFDLESRFLWLDRVEETAQVLSALDVFVSASHRESFEPMLEAMACGVAIVATATESAKEFIENERNGKLIPAGNPARLAESINELLSGANERAALGARARKTALEKFGVKNMIDEIRAIYRRVLNDRE